MKTRLALIITAAILSACQNSPAPRAYGVKPVAPITRGCRYTATWGGPLVHWIDNTNGHRWTCTYAEFFQYCGGRHPNALGIAVKGQLPAEITTTPAPAYNASEPSAAAMSASIPTEQPAPSVLYRPVYSTPQSQR